MIQKYDLYPGITLRCFPDTRFKQGSMTIQLVSPIQKDTVALNALLPAVLLRGSVSTPDLRAITCKLDNLYGAGVGSIVRRVGDYHCVGLSCNFISDRFALAGDRVLEPVLDYLRELLLEPVLENGVFRAEYVESEKRNLITGIAAQRNDKRAYCSDQMFKKLCEQDSYGIPRLGTIEAVKEITPESLYENYRKLLRTARIDVFYVGQGDLDQIAKLVGAMFRNIERDYYPLPPQTALTPVKAGRFTEELDIAQGKLCMGFTTPINLREGNFAAMQLANVLFGGGMTSKLFMNIREKMSLCYDIGSGYYSGKGIVTVSAGIDWDKAQLVQEEVLRQLKDLCRGAFSEEELEAGRQALLSGLRGTHDTVGSIEGYYATAALSGQPYDPAGYMKALEAVTREDIIRAARTLTLDTVYLLKGVEK